MPLDDIADQGEESGRVEAGDEWCCGVRLRVCSLSDETYRALHREVRQRGQARAQGPLYGLSGRRARVFSEAWALGYLAQWAMWQRECRMKKEHPYEEEPVA